MGQAGEAADAAEDHVARATSVPVAAATNRVSGSSVAMGVAFAGPAEDEGRVGNAPPRGAGAGTGPGGSG